MTNLTRTITWQDPTPALEAGVMMSGLDYMTALRAGQLPASPITVLAGIEPVDVARGQVAFTSTADPSFTNPLGLIHGGYLCTLLDAAAAAAVHTTLAAGTVYTSMEIKVNFLRPVRPGDRVSVRGWVTKPGNHVAFAESEVQDVQGRPVANATTTCLIRQLQ